jgi:hypothetical protein
LIGHTVSHFHFKKLYLLMLFLLLIAAQDSQAQYKFLKWFPDQVTLSTWPGGINNGIAVDPAGKIWVQSYAHASGVDSVGSVKTGVILVFNPDGTQTSFSPIKILSGNDEKGIAVTDTLTGSGDGLSVDPSSGNVLSTKPSDRLWKIDYRTGKGITRILSPIPDYGYSLGSPMADKYGEVFVVPVLPSSQVAILNSDFARIGSAVSSTAGYARAIAVSADGKDVYVPGFEILKTYLYHSDNGSIGPYVKKDSILLGMCVESMTWHPKTGLLWVSSGNITSGMPTNGLSGYAWYAYSLFTKQYVDSIKWYGPVNSDPRPRGIAFSPTGDTAYVGEYNGSVPSPIQMWVKAAPTMPPAAPSLASPSNGATVPSISPTLVWNSPSGASSYRLQVGTDSSFSSVIFDNATLTATQLQVGPLSNNAKYFWRVSATNLLGGSSYSPIWSFMTAVTIPISPILASPQSGATGVSTSSMFSWTPVTGATNYHLQVSISPAFSSTAVDKDSINTPFFRVAGLMNSVLYYWRVSGWNVVGTSPYSTTWSFTTVVAPPPAPTLALPADGSMAVALKPTLTWSGSSGAVSYRLQVATSPTFSSIVFDQNCIAGTSTTISGLANITPYYWRVSATNDGGQSPYSVIWSFTTTAVAPATFLSVVSPPSVQKGSEFLVYVMVADSARPVNMFGIGFDLNFSNSSYVDFVSGDTNGCYLGGNLLYILTPDSANRKVSVGLSRKVPAAGVVGGGMVIKLKFHASQTAADNAKVIFSFSNISANDATGTAIVLSPIPDTTIIAANPVVWPGDTNNDGVVNQNDVLPVGLYWAMTGPARLNASNQWTAQSAIGWSNRNATYADANGDGIVNQAEVLSIGLNWGKSHNLGKTGITDTDDPPSSSIASGTATLRAIGPASVIGKTTFEISVVVGDSAKPVSNLFAIALVLDFASSKSMIQATEATAGAFLGSDIIFLRKVDNQTGTVAVGITRKSGANAIAGTGELMRVKFQVVNNSNSSTFSFTTRDITADDAQGHPIMITQSTSSILGSVSDIIIAPSEYKLFQNYPNPFNPSTKIIFTVPKVSRVMLSVIDALGRNQAVLVKGEKTPGTYEVEWNASRVPSGIYFYRLQAGEFEETKKMLLVR